MQKMIIHIKTIINRKNMTDRARCTHFCNICMYLHISSRIFYSYILFRFLFYYNIKHEQKLYLIIIIISFLQSSLNIFIYKLIY